MTTDRAATTQWTVPAIWAGAGALLLSPLVAMQVSDAVTWDAADFLLFGAMLAAMCGGFQLMLRGAGGAAHRLAAAIALLTGFALVWVDLAVGIVGSTPSPLLMAVPGVAVLGAFVARFRSAGMARAMVATALAQVLAGIVMLATGPAAVPIPATLAFTALWLVAAALFRRG